MCAIYAFMRYCDDISEGEGASREGIEQWRRIWTARSKAAMEPICCGRPFMIPSSATTSRASTSTK